MYNLQLIDTDSGGSFAFERNDYPIDQGVYSELYAALFGTSSAEWWGDGAFGTVSENISSRTEITIKNNSTITEAGLNLIKKAVNDDLTRFTNKNKNIEIEAVEIAYSGRMILIIIELTGYNDAFNFIYNQTGKSLENINWQSY